MVPVMPSDTSFRTVKKRAFRILGNKCVKCGFSDWRALQIDHISGNGYQQRKTHPQLYAMRYVASGRTDAKEEYQLLCANCNWIKCWENGELNGHRCVSNSSPKPLMASA